MQEGKLVEVGDLVKISSKNIRPSDEYDGHLGIVVSVQHVGSYGKSATVLYDIHLSEMDQLLTISDIFFEIWRIDDQRSQRNEPND